MKNEKILETERLYLRKLKETDYDDLCEMLQDEKCMHAYKKKFTEEECQAWLERNMARYDTLGFGFWAVIDKKTGNFLGQAGLSVKNVEGKDEVEIGYFFLRKYWGKGYASEVSKAILDYAQNELKQDRIVALVGADNPASAAVAKKLGMKLEKTYDRDCYGIIIPHEVYAVN